jgi:hypothetical protein
LFIGSTPLKTIREDSGEYAGPGFIAKACVKRAARDVNPPDLLHAAWLWVQ